MCRIIWNDDECRADFPQWVPVSAILIGAVAFAIVYSLAFWYVLGLIFDTIRLYREGP